MTEPAVLVIVCWTVDPYY